MIYYEVCLLLEDRPALPVSHYAAVMWQPSQTTCTIYAFWVLYCICNCNVNSNTKCPSKSLKWAHMHNWLFSQQLLWNVITKSWTEHLHQNALLSVTECVVWCNILTWWWSLPHWRKSAHGLNKCSLGTGKQSCQGLLKSPMLLLLFLPGNLTSSASKSTKFKHRSNVLSWICVSIVSQIEKLSKV